MKSLLLRYATPLITGLFLVSLVSGAALFFHIGSSTFHSMHEWLSMLLILPVALHIWKNWRAFTRYFKGLPLALALAASLAAAGAFGWSTLRGGATGRGRPPQFALSQKVMQATLPEMAAVLDLPAETLSAHLIKAGFTPTEGASLSQIARTSGHSETELAAALTGAGG